jgi:hypothetical protein
MVQETKLISQDGRTLLVLKDVVEFMMRQNVDFSFFGACGSSILYCCAVCICSLLCCSVLTEGVRSY